MIKPYTARCSTHEIDFVGPDAFAEIAEHLKTEHPRKTGRKGDSRKHPAGWKLPSKAAQARFGWPRRPSGDGVELDVEGQEKISAAWAVALRRREALLAAGAWLQTYTLPATREWKDPFNGGKWSIRERPDNERGRTTHLPGCPEIRGHDIVGGGERYDVQWLATVALAQLDRGVKWWDTPWGYGHRDEPDWIWCPSCLGEDTPSESD
jgi:hypothetical protein